MSLLLTIDTSEMSSEKRKRVLDLVEKLLDFIYEKDIPSKGEDKELKELKEKYPNHRKPWSEQEVKQLKDELLKKMSHEDIAKAHGRTLNGINERLLVFCRQFIRDMIAAGYVCNEEIFQTASDTMGLSIAELNDGLFSFPTNEKWVE